MREGIFLERPNRFIAHVELDGETVVVHVKNTGRCRELLIPGAKVYIRYDASAKRKTSYDLIAVQKGDRLINMDSQIPNAVAAQYVESGGLIKNVTRLKREYTYGRSRIDLYAEDDKGKRHLIEVKGVTLEENGVCLFPDAPSERAVKHIDELIAARNEGYETWIFFLIQMEQVTCFVPNEATQPAFADALRRAADAGVHIAAYSSIVTPNSIEIDQAVPVLPDGYGLARGAYAVTQWYVKNKRDLPWRRRVSAYRVWISEIMLQQTRVEAVKPYYERFIKELPDVKALAEVDSDHLMKLWEGLGYYSRARHLKEAAVCIMEEHNGVFPDDHGHIRALKGVGSYTAGAISAFAYNQPYPAVDGNVLRVVARLIGLHDDILQASTKKKVEHIVAACIPQGRSSDFGQGLIELGALICLPGGQARCAECPVHDVCRAYERDLVETLPVRVQKTKKRIEKRTVLQICHGDRICIGKRPDRGLLAGMYELPNLPGHMTEDDVIRTMSRWGMPVIRCRRLPEAKHIFSHITWDMIGYVLEIDELDVGKIQIRSDGVSSDGSDHMFFVSTDQLRKSYAVPGAFSAYMPALETDSVL